MYAKIKRRMWLLTEKNTDADPWYELFNTSILILIILNICAIVLESFEGFHAAYRHWFFAFEAFSVAVFTLEYFLRLWVCNLSTPEKGAVRSRIAYMFSPMALVDISAILPFYLPMFFAVDLRFLRILRLMRVFRIFKITRYTSAVDMMLRVFRRHKADFIVTLVCAFFVVLISSTIMFYLEHDVQPKAFPNIVAAFWWAIATLTTVGYGDVYPVTAAGKVLSAFIAIIGIGLVALPTGILSSGFMDELRNKREAEKNLDRSGCCPHCGKKISGMPVRRGSKK